MISFSGWLQTLIGPDGAQDARGEQMTEVTKQSMNSSAQRRGAVKVELWDEFDPVANALLVLIEAQNLVQRAFNATCEERGDGTFATDSEVGAALAARSDAIMQMLVAQKAVQEDNTSAHASVVDRSHP